MQAPTQKAETCAKPETKEEERLQEAMYQAGEPGNEHKEKPSGASTDREAEIAGRLQTVELQGKENGHGEPRARQSVS
ncbi:hypothetical protein D3C75_600730 [compost metagenome]